MIWHLAMFITIACFFGSVSMSWSQAVVDVEPEAAQQTILQPLQLRESLADIKDRVRSLEMKMAIESKPAKKNQPKFPKNKPSIRTRTYPETKKFHIEIIKTVVNKRIWTWEKFDAQRKMRQETVGD